MDIMRESKHVYVCMHKQERVRKHAALTRLLITERLRI